MTIGVEPDTRRIEWTERQREVLDLLACDYTNAQIGEKLGITLDGAKWHVSEVMSKLGVERREEAAAYWRRQRRLSTRLAGMVAAALGAIRGGRVLAAFSAAAVVGLAVGLVVAANRGDDEPSAAETPEVATPAAPATVTPASSPSATVAVAPPTIGSGRRTGLAVVVSERPFPATSQGGPHPWTVSVFDLATGATKWSWDFGSTSEGPIAAGLAGRHIVTLTEASADLRELDGTVVRTFRAVNPSQGSKLYGLGVSNSGELIALSEAASCIQDTLSNRCSTLRFFDVASGNLLSTVGPAEFIAANYDGVPNGPKWLGDDSGVLVRGSVQRDGHGSIATVHLDGTITTFLNVNGWAEASPRAKYLAEHQNLQDMCAVGRPLALRETATGRRVATLGDEDFIFSADRWAPDESRLLLRRFANDRPCGSRVGYSVLDLATGALTPEPDPDALLAAWASPSIRLERCGTGVSRDGYFSGGFRALVCDAGGEAYVEGLHLGPATVLIGVGILDP